MAYAPKHPGALSAYFLAAIYQRMSKGQIRETRGRRDVSVSQWAVAHTGLQELRDTREVQTMALVLD